MAGFVGLCHYLDVEPSVAVFRYFFRLWPLLYRIRNRAVFSEMPQSSTYWKGSFFLVWSPVPWACPVVWGKPSESSLAERDFRDLTEGERSAERKLFDAVDRYTHLAIHDFLHLYDEINDGSVSSSAMVPPPVMLHLRAKLLMDWVMR
jgi:hypothetical protein